MKLVELYGRVRYAVRIEGISRREAARRFGIDPRTVATMVTFSVPTGYRRSRPPARPKLDGLCQVNGEEGIRTDATHEISCWHCTEFIGYPAMSLSM